MKKDIKQKLKEIIHVIYESNVLGGVKVYDNGGETLDRYSIILPDGSVFTMSENPTSPNGVNQYAGEASDLPGATDGQQVDAASLPTEVKRAIQQRMSGGSMNEDSEGRDFPVDRSVVVDIIEKFIRMDKSAARYAFKVLNIKDTNDLKGSIAKANDQALEMVLLNLVK